MTTTEKTILVIDDDSEIRNSLRVVLDREGYRVVLANDGNAGLTKVEQESPDLVIVDMMMPKKSGFLVLEKLRQHDNSYPPIIMITANEGSRHRAYAEMLGVNAYIRKPFAMDQILETIRKLCPLVNTSSDEDATKA